jgi:hypothetical protein
LATTERGESGFRVLQHCLGPHSFGHVSKDGAPFAVQRIVFASNLLRQILAIGLAFHPLPSHQAAHPGYCRCDVLACVLRDSLRPSTSAQSRIVVNLLLDGREPIGGLH